jgi:hypothetical protein
MAKKNNTAEKTILNAEKVTKALKEGTEKQLQSILNETLSKLIKEEEDVEENEDDVVADDGYEVEDVETEETSIDDETPEEEGEEAEVDTEDADDEWSELEEFKVGDNDYDFTGVDGETALKVYNKLNDEDEIFVTKDEDGNYEFKDEETGAEYVIELDADGSEEADAEDDLDFEDDEEIELDLGGEEDEDFGNEEEIELDLGGEGDEDFEDEEDEIEIDLGDEEDEDDDLLNEDDNLGYTDSYQDEDPIEGLNASLPVKNGTKDWNKKLPTGTKKPWAGKGNMKPFGEKTEMDENITTTKSQKRNTVAKTMAPNSGEEEKPEVSKNVSVAGKMISESKVKKIVEAAKAIQAENKLYKESIEKIKKSLYEAAVLNVNLGKIVSLLVNETTTKEEKQNILERFNNVKTLKEGNALYESIKKELNVSTKKTTVMERQISMKPSLNETTFYTSNPSLDMMRRMENLETYYKK